MRAVVVLPLRPLQVGDSFTLARWPLHLTVVPTFVAEGNLEAVVAIIKPLLQGGPPLELRVGADEGFGRAQRIPVSLIEPTTELNALHRGLIAVLTARGAVFDDLDFIGSGYRPHITVTKLDRVQPGDLLRLEQATIVDMEPIGLQRLREVVWVTPLEHQHSGHGG